MKTVTKNKTNVKKVLVGLMLMTAIIYYDILLLLSTAPSNQVRMAALPANTTSLIGVNIGESREYSTEIIFVDAMKRSTPWASVKEWDREDGRTLSLDSNGWVKSLLSGQWARKYLFTGEAIGHYPSGQYIVLYNGSGTIKYSPNAVKDENASKLGREVINVSNNSDFYIDIMTTNSSNYIKDLRVILPGYESTYQTQPFYPVFLQKLSDASALRYMDFGRTNGNPLTSWSQRTLTSFDSQNKDQGVALEYMISLANITSKDPWFTIPAMVNDNYLTNFAQLVKSTLNSNRKIYIEYSNEVWNSFPQGAWVEQQGLNTWPISNPTNNDRLQRRLNYFGMRTAQICDIVKNVWGTDKNRVVCVMGSQNANYDISDKPLACALWTSGAPCYKHGIDAVAVAPYVGAVPNDTDPASDYHISKVKNWTVENVFTDMYQKQLPLITASIKMQKGVADKYGIKLIAYEGGQGLSFATQGLADNNLSLAAVFSNANRDARMKDVYDKLFAAWFNNGGKLFMHYFNVGASTQYGSWGLLEYQNQGTSPKYESFVAAIARYTETSGDTTAPITTASPTAGTYPVGQKVSLVANEPATIYYCLTTSNGSCTPSITYTTPLTINFSQALFYYSKDSAGNKETVKKQVYTVNTLVTTASPVTGTYSTMQTVTLTANKSGVTIYYGTSILGNSCNPVVVYTGPVVLYKGPVTLCFYARTATETETVKRQNYIYSYPLVTKASPAGGTYTTSTSASLIANKYLTTIYYCLANIGSACTPTTVATKPILIDRSQILKFYARDTYSGTNETVKQEIYTITICPTYYQDRDGDGYGNSGVTVKSCSPVSGYSLQGNDCNDGNRDINPGKVELCATGVDENCNYVTDESPCEYFKVFY
ncbi:MAG: chitobiase/beta-hexosaminidase C-terminal domain-containing protein [Candidatus Buchananbacteria bacterium]